MATCFTCLLFFYLFNFINATSDESKEGPKSGKFYKSPSIIEKDRSNELVRGMRTFWFEHSIKMIRQMSHEILIDANSKMYYTEMLKKKFEHSIRYQLGSTAASIMDEFESMLVTYRRYANMTTFKKERKMGVYDLTSFTEGFLTIPIKLIIFMFADFSINCATMLHPKISSDATTHVIMAGAGCFTLVYGVIKYTKDELMNIDLEPIDRATKLLWGWDQKMRIYNRPNKWYSYDTEAMGNMQRVGVEAQAILDDFDNWITINETEPYYFDIPRKNKAYFELVRDSMTVNAERIMMSAGEHQNRRTRQCLAIANTMINSRMDIQRYYKIRYLYTWTLHYEVGYVSHEILRHYTVVIDLFHLVYTRFNKHRFDDFTPARYMLYIYSVILFECKQIIKLCHMLHEVEKKYSNFADQTQLWREMPSSGEQLQKAKQRQKDANAKAWALYNAELDRARAEKMRALKKKHKKALAAFKGSLSGGGAEAGKKISGSGFGSSKKEKKGRWSPADYFYGSVNATNQKKSGFPHIYGWSIENFP